MISFIWCSIAILALLSCIFVVSTIDPVNRLVSLIGTYLAGSLLYAILDYYFLSLTYIIVYVGAIAILFLFVIMMIPVAPVTATTMGKVTMDDSAEGMGLGVDQASKGSNLSLIGKLALALGVVMSILFISLNVDVTGNLVGMESGTMAISSDWMGSQGIVAYFNPSWATAYVSLSDVYTLGFMIYLAYPISLILIGLALWITLIGVIPLTSI
uniref:NADH-ubiquinone oxidoreductase chain 6 n=1 Tax=Chytriomyces confervae TaxID=246404 RepID=A0A4P8NP86_9FUNG|nr:NADH dehydrogenase subunit 6 [Chytriomyces confervae]QCQ69063.1 NADH dehydrogenase subunit 6 [Chytriomyces confervae]